ncbi:MAG: hypothetical protein KAR44_03625 [Candidatus Aegiribacteria sp.]|nr:hypothetical protein [Candidatus Aegiribacteria sp.]
MKIRNRIQITADGDIRSTYPSLTIQLKWPITQIKEIPVLSLETIAAAEVEGQGINFR